MGTAVLVSAIGLDGQSAAGLAVGPLIRHAVARHKAMFFTENDMNARRIDHEAAVSGALQLVSAGTAHGVLANDYARMLADGMLSEEDESFDEVMERCAAIEVLANNE